MKNLRAGVFLVLSSMLVAACIAYEDAQGEFCRNADARQREALCGIKPEEPTGPNVADAGADASDAGADASDAGADASDAGADASDGGTEALDAGSDAPCSPSSCTTPPPCHEPVGTCTALGCAYPLKKAGAACDDGQLCTLNDQCNSAGNCVGSAKVCNSAPGQCYQPTGTCNASSGNCEYGPKPAGTVCEANNTCTDDTCDGNGNCRMGDEPFCPDRRSECLVADVCAPQLACTYHSICQENEFCRQGTCCRAYNADEQARRMVPPYCLEQEPTPE